jgi:hypothetical protein
MHKWINRDLWIQLRSLWSRDIHVAWVPGHKGVLGNIKADALANIARTLPLPTTVWWTSDYWRVFHQGNEITSSLTHITLTGIPTLDIQDINKHLSFCNLIAFVTTLRFKWVWGRTGWEGTAPYWHRDPLPCPFAHMCAHTAPHFTDLFSLIADCPAFEPYRAAFFHLWGNAAGLVQLWFTSASRPDRRNFIRSLIPTTLVARLLQIYSAPQIQTFVNSRDRQWCNTVSHLRTVYSTTLQPFSQLLQNAPGQGVPHPMPP